MILLVLSAGLFSLQSIFSKFCYQTGFTILSLLTGRYMLALIILGIWCIVQKIPPFLPTGQRRIGILLGLLSASTITLLFTAFAYLPAAVAISCYYAYPMLTVLWCCIFLEATIGTGTAYIPIALRDWYHIAVLRRHSQRIVRPRGSMCLRFRCYHVHSGYADGKAYVVCP